MFRAVYFAQMPLVYLVGIFFLQALSPLQAHEIRPTLVDIDFQANNQFEVSIRLNLEALLAGVGVEHSDTDDSANAQYYNQLRAMPPAALAKVFAQQQKTFVERLNLASEFAPLPLELQQINVPEVGDLALARDSVITLRGLVPEDVQKVRWQADASLGANILRVNRADIALFSTYLQAGKQSEEIAIREDEQPTSLTQAFSHYVEIGFAHIIPKGLDHILFVLGLFLLSPYWKHLLWQVTAFTLAHSVTLALSVLAWIQLPANIVEPLIAASIVYICVENLFQQRMTNLRPLIVFAFGLLHGVGFASVLSDIGLPTEHFILSLLAFNIGVELGQIAVLALCFVLVGFWFRQASWYRSAVTIPASLAIAVVGSYWFVERIGWV